MILKLEELYEKFNTFIIEKDRYFTSFDNPYIKSNEDYKKTLESEGYKNLKLNTWTNSKIGSGYILDCVKDAVNTKDNNLVIHDDRRGSNARQDKSLFVKYTDKQLEEFEQYFYDLYKGNIPDEESFNKLIKYCGKIYPFMAYLFFLKSAKTYLPIAPRTFDKIFKKLGLDFRTSGKCSWENYQDYLQIIKNVKDFISIKEKHQNEDIVLLDAHSFLWITMQHIPNDFTTNQLKQEVKFEMTTPSSEGIKVPKYQSQKTHSSNTVEEQKRKDINGKKSEEIVLRYERNKFKNHKDYDKIINVSNNNSLGYDIQTIDNEGNLKFIEVKTEGYKKSFIISRNEITQLNNKENYFIYVVNNPNKKPKIQELNISHIKINDIISDNGLEFYPINFRVHF